MLASVPLDIASSALPRSGDDEHMSRFSMGNSQERSPERAKAIERYLLLHNRQSHLRSRLSCNSSRSSTSAYPTPSTTSPSTPRSWSLSSSPLSTSPIAAHAIPTIPTIPEEAEAELDNTLAAQNELFEISNAIKATLTDLLNCETVRKDESFRQWIQQKLMEAEMDLKKQRRRRSSNSDRMMAESIHERMDRY